MLSAVLPVLPSIVLAGSFKTVPVKVFLDARTKTEVLKIVNEGDERLTVQLSAAEWTQNEAGEDVYSATKDLVFFPKMADIERGKERIVRVGYQGKAPASTEKAYRLFVEELPVTKPGETALKLALRVSLPIFVKPQKEIKEWAIGGLELSEEVLTVKVKNSGNAHVIVGKITATGSGDSGKGVFARNVSGWYALAGVSKPFAVGVSRKECLETRTINVTAEAEKVVREGTLDVDRTMCMPKKEGSKGADRNNQ